MQIISRGSQAPLPRGRGSETCETTEPRPRGSGALRVHNNRRDFKRTALIRSAGRATVIRRDAKAMLPFLRLPHGRLFPSLAANAVFHPISSRNANRCSAACDSGRNILLRDAARPSFANFRLVRQASFRRVWEHIVEFAGRKPALHIHPVPDREEIAMFSAEIVAQVWRHTQEPLPFVH